MNFFKPQPVTLKHTGKGEYLCSNGATIKFNKIGSFIYAKVNHRDGLNIFHFDSPLKSQKAVLAPVIDFLSKYNFTLEAAEVKKQLEVSDTKTLSELDNNRTQTFKQIYG